MTAKRTELRVGTSGWQYNHWKGVFYPKDIPKREWFSYYAGRFDTVEVNNTFYHLPSAETFDQWHEQAPNGFCYVLKYSRFGTHIKRLKDPGQHLEPFLERAERLKSGLGPILVQLPPRWSADPERLQAFLVAAPKRCRWALEFRDPSWLCDDIYAILRKHKAALCVHDMIEDHPREVTADWVYLRYHGGAHHGGNYPHQALSAKAKRIREYRSAGRDVFAYFNNDQHGYAIANAAGLRRYAEGG